MAANLLSDMGADVPPRTASDPLEKLSYYGIPNPSSALESIYQSSRMQSSPSSVSNPSIDATGMSDATMAAFQGNGIPPTSFHPGTLLPNLRRFGTDSMYSVGQSMSPSYGGYSPSMYGTQFPMAARYPGMNPMMAMYGQNFYRPYLGRRMRRRNRHSKYGSRLHKRYRRPRDDYDAEIYNDQSSRSSSYSGPSESHARYNRIAANSEPEYSNQVDSGNNYADYTPSPSETYYKISTGLSGGSNKEFLKIGGIGSNIFSFLANSLLKTNKLADKPATDSSKTTSIDGSKESSTDGPFIQLGSTRITLKQNSKGGITVTVGKSDTR